MADITVKIRSDNREFNQGLKQSDQQVGNFEQRLSKLRGTIMGTFAVGLAANFFKQTISGAVELGAQMTHLAEQSGLTLRAFQALATQGLALGVKAETLAMGVGNLTKYMAEAANGNDQYIKKFAELGISMDAVKNSSPERVIEMLGAKMSKGSLSVKEFAAAYDLLGGRAARQLIPVLARVGSEGLDPMIEKWEELGLVMSNSAATSMESVSTTWDLLKRRFTNGWAELISMAVVGAQAHAKAMEGMFKGKNPFTEFFSQYQAIMAEYENAAAKSRDGGGDGGDTPDAKTDKARLDIAKMLADESLRQMGALERIQELQKRIADLQQAQVQAIASGDMEKRAEALRDQIKYEHQLDAIRKQRADDEAKIARIIAESSREQLNDDERLAEIQSAIADAIEAQIKAIEDQDPAARKAALEDQMKLEKEAESVIVRQAKKKEDETKQRKELADIEKGDWVKVQSPQADQLARIGGYTGGQFSAQDRIAERQRQIDEKRNEYLARIDGRIASLTEESGE